MPLPTTFYLMLFVYLKGEYMNIDIIEQCSKLSTPELVQHCLDLEQKSALLGGLAIYSIFILLFAVGIWVLWENI